MPPKAELFLSIDIEPGNPLSSQEINEKILNGISEDALHGKKVLILCEDNTRATPIHIFFPEFLNRLQASDAASVSILFAVGTHRSMTEEEMLKKLGLTEEQAKEANISLTNHNASDETNLIEIGEIGGQQFKINRAVEAADMIISLNNVVPHTIFGFSGGAKMIHPGISDKASIGWSHSQRNSYPDTDIEGQIDNPMRALLDEVTGLVQQKYPDKSFICVSPVTTPDGIVEVYTGSFSDSYRQAAELSRSIYVQEIDAQPNMLLAYVDPNKSDFWQAAQAVYNCAGVIQDGGTIIISGEFADGFSPIHGKTIIHYGGYATPEVIETNVQKLRAKEEPVDDTVVSHMKRVGAYLKRGIRIIISSNKISPETCQQAGLDYLDPNQLGQISPDLIVHHATDILLQLKVPTVQIQQE